LKKKGKSGRSGVKRKQPTTSIPNHVAATLDVLKVEFADFLSHHLSKICNRRSFIPSIKNKQTKVYVKLTDQDTNNLLLLDDTNGLSSSAGGLGMLTSDTDTPEMSDTSMTSDFLESFQIVSQLRFQNVSVNLSVSTGLVISLSVQEPQRNVIFQRLLDDINKLVDFGSGQFTSSLVGVNLSSLAGQDRKSSANTLNGGQGEGDLLATIDVGVANTKNVNEVVVID